jgi:hypothetical protein
VPDRKHGVWRGLAFELVCFQHSHIVAEKLGFSAVNYECGSWFSQAPGQARHQIDLLFVRADRVITNSFRQHDDDGDSSRENNL